jgi:putative transposase
VKWKGQRTFISERFASEPLGLQQMDERCLQIYDGPILLRWLDGYRHRFSRRKPKALLQEA